MVTMEPQSRVTVMYADILNIKRTNATSISR
jgi:hypothetical protein